MTFELSHNKDFYFEYHRIGNKAYRDKVRYYEENKSSVGHLSYEERVDVELDYVICLFEIGKYHKFLSKVESLIVVVIQDNIYNYNGINIYNDLLFKKSACLFNTGQYNKSEKILKTVVNLDPENDFARTLYGRCKRKQGRDWYEISKGLAMVFIIASIGIAMAEIFFFKPFYPEIASSIGSLKFILFFVGILSILLNEAYLSYVIGKEIGYKFDLKEIKKRILP